MKLKSTPVRRRACVSCLSFIVALFAFSAIPAHAQNKWHPGHYMRASVESPSATISDTDLNFVVGESSLKGVTIPYYWAVLESTQGTYDFSRIEHQLSVLSAGGKRLIVEVWDVGFPGTPWTTMDTNVLPSYLATLSGANGGWAATNSGGCSRSWLAPVMTRYLALMQALAAEFDGNPYFEMIACGESSRGLNPIPTDYTTAAFLTQWADNWAPAMRTAWKSSNIWLGVNYVKNSDSGGNDISDLIGECYSHNIMVGGPDAFINADNSTPGTKVVNGVNGTLGDLRGLIGLRYDQQVKANPTDTPALVYDNAVQRTTSDPKALRANYMSWSPHHTDSTMDWEDDVLPFLRLNPTTVMTLPASYIGPFTFQGEWPLLGATSGDAATTASDALADAGAYLRYDSNADGDYVTLTVEVPKNQLYTIAVRYQKWMYQAKVQLSIDGTNQGSLQDLYSASKTYQTISLGTKTLSTGNHSFKFTVNGKNASSTDREIRIDSIILTP